MTRWILCIVVALVTLYVAFWGWFLLWALFSTDGHLIVASEGSELRVQQNGVEVVHGTARVVGVSKPVLALLVVWYAVLAILALVGVWFVAAGRKPQQTSA